MYKNKKILGIILARSGSKRVKYKNILNFCGKPLFYWTLLAAKKSKYLDNIIISTNDKKIINYTKKLSYVETTIRSEKLCGHNITSEDVVLDLISKLEKKFDVIVVLQPTSPLRKRLDIDYAIRKMINENDKFIVSVCHRRKSHKYMIETKKGYFKRIKKKSSGYALNGAIYAAETSYFKKTRSFFTKKTLIFPMPASRSVDIDTFEDFNMAKSKFKNK